MHVDARGQDRADIHERASRSNMPSVTNISRSPTSSDNGTRTSSRTPTARLPVLSHVAPNLARLFVKPSGGGPGGGAAPPPPPAPGGSARGPAPRQRGGRGGGGGRGGRAG